ncbi:type II secretion system F family protein [Patescibacteria group bacterium]
MKFHYQATARDGKKIRGNLEAESRLGAVQELKGRELVITSLTVEQKARDLSFGKVSFLDKVILAKHLAIMLHSGVSLNESLKTLELQATGKMKKIYASVRAQVEAGKPFSVALSDYEHVFGKYFINVIRAGEVSGSLAQNLEELSIRMGKDYLLQKKARGAMLYPIIVLTLTVGLGLVVSVFVLPSLTNLFRAFEFDLPLSTRILIAVSKFLVEYGTITILAFVLAVILVIWVAKQSFATPVFHRFYIYVPFLKKVTKLVNLSRFSTILGSLLKSGIPIDRALKITADVLGNEMYSRSLRQILPRVDAGEPLSSGLRGQVLFPAFLTQMIQVGEETGKLEDVLLYLGGFYESEFESTMKNLSTIIEPVLLIVIGLVVTGVALAIITPIYSFIDVIG